MDLNDLNTRVVFKEPRGMVRWLQLLFAIIAISTVMDFSTTVGVDITCPPEAVTTVTTPQTNPTSSLPTQVPSASSSSVIPPTSNNNNQPSTQQEQVVANASPIVVQQQQINHVKLVIKYPFDFANQAPVYNPCKNHNYTYAHLTSLSGSPFFFSMTGFMALLYAAISLVVYLFFSINYNSTPMIPVIDLTVSGIISVFWLLASLSFSVGVSLLKATASYENVEQGLCQPPFVVAGGQCTNPEDTEWKSLNIGLLSGYTSFFIWAVGMWFVYKETHFHTPRDQLG